MLEESSDRNGEIQEAKDDGKMLKRLAVNSWVLHGLACLLRNRPKLADKPQPREALVKTLATAYDEADHNVTIEEFTTDDKFDVAFCLGSINFGSFDTIIAQIDRVVNLLKPNARIYWRSNPGQNDHPHEDCNKIDFFPWTFDKHRKFAEMFGFEVTDLKWDNCDRIYAVWERSVNTIPSK